MPTPSDYLSPIDYQIIEYVANNYGVTMHQIVQHFGSKIAAIDSRLAELACGEDCKSTPITDRESTRLNSSH